MWPRRRFGAPEPSVPCKQLSALPAFVIAGENSVRSIIPTRRTVLGQDGEIIGIAAVMFEKRDCPRRSGFLQCSEQIQEPPAGIGDSRTSQLANLDQFSSFGGQPAYCAVGANRQMETVGLPARI